MKNLHPRSLALAMIGQIRRTRDASGTAEVEAKFASPLARRWLAGMSTLAVCALVGSVLFGTDVVRVQSIVVLGSHSLSSQDLSEASGIHIGQAMWTVDERSAEQSIARTWNLSNVHVTLRWPHTAEIRVSESSAVANLVSASQTRVLLSDGRVTDRAESGPQPQTTVEVTPSLLDDSTANLSVLNAAAFVQSLSVEPNVPVKRATLDDANQLSMYLSTGVEILVGEPVLLEAKRLSILAMLSGRVVQTGICRLDVRDPGVPKIKRTPSCDAPAPTTGPVEPVQAKPAIEIGDEEANLAARVMAANAAGSGQRPAAHKPATSARPKVTTTTTSATATTSKSTTSKTTATTSAAQTSGAAAPTKASTSTTTTTIRKRTN